MAVNQTKLGLSVSGSEHAAGSAAPQRQQRAAAADDFLLDSKSLALCWRFLLQVLASSFFSVSANLAGWQLADWLSRVCG